MKTHKSQMDWGILSTSLRESESLVLYFSQCMLGQAVMPVKHSKWGSNLWGVFLGVVSPDHQQGAASQHDSSYQATTAGSIYQHVC